MPFLLKYRTCCSVLLPIMYISLILNYSVVAGEEKDTLVWPPAPERARIRFVESISSPRDLHVESGFFSKVLGLFFGREDNASWLVQPVGVLVSPNKKIFISDPGAHGVHIINKQEKEYRFLYELKKENFRSPIGMALSAQGDLYVSDSELGEIVVFDDDLDETIHIKDSLERPTGIAIHGDTLYVVDAGKHRIVLMNLQGKYLSSIGNRGTGNGEFNFPINLAWSGKMFVVDALNYRVQTFDPSGHFLSSFGKQGTVTGCFASPKAVALDSDRNIYVTDALMDNFQIYNSEGQLLLVVGKRGESDGEFLAPGGIAIDNDDTIYVVDSLNKRIEVFKYVK